MEKTSCIRVAPFLTLKSAFHSTIADRIDSNDVKTVTRESLETLTFDVDDTWTNQTFNDAVCNNASNVNALGLTVRSTLANILWFKIPSCIASWTQLQSLECFYCQFTNMTALPSSLQSLALTYAKDSWTQSITGRVASGSPFANHFDWDWINDLPSLTHVTISSCGLQGTLPNDLSHPSLASLVLDGAFAPRNQLTGTIAPDFFVRFPALHTINLSDNQLTGTIPSSGIESLEYLIATNNQFTYWPSFVSNTSTGFGPPNNLTYVELNSNQLVEIPSFEDLTNLPSLTYFHIGSNAGLSGTLPNIWAQVIPRTSSNRFTMFDASFCNFSGPLPEMPEEQAAAYSSSTTSLVLNNNQFTGTIPTSWSNVTFKWLSLSGNPGLTGTIAQIDPVTGALSSPLAKDIELLALDSDGITGPMFNITAMPSLRSLFLQTRNADFCGTARIVVASDASAEGALLFPSAHSSGFVACNLINTNASDCAWAFASNCIVSNAPTSPIVPAIPPAIPSAAPSPPTITPSPVAIPCPLPSPGPSFECIDDTWTSYTSVNQSTITVSSPTVIFGNLTTSTIIISSSSATINVTGCIDASMVTIVLTDADVALLEPKHGQTLTRRLLTQSSSCPTLALENVNVNNRGVNSCKKIKTSQVETSSGLVVALTLDSSRCHVWWIVLVSVIGGVIVLVAISLVIYCIAVQMRKKQPHSELETSEPLEPLYE